MLLIILQYLLIQSQVGVGIGNDAGKVYRDYNVSVKVVKDLQYLADQKLGKFSQRWGLGSLTETLISKQVIIWFFSKNSISL